MLATTLKSLKQSFPNHTIHWLHGPLWLRPMRVQDGPIPELDSVFVPSPDSPGMQGFIQGTDRHHACHHQDRYVMSTIALSATTQRHPFSQLTATQRRRCSPDPAVPASRYRCCHAKPGPIAGCVCSPPRINSQNHRPFIVAASRRHIPVRLKSPQRAAAKPIPILTATSCLGASRTPAAGARRGVCHAGVRETYTQAAMIWTW